MHTIQSLYGKQLYMPKLKRQVLIDALQPLLPYYASRDRRIITDRVCETILTRQAAL